jgi:hypothetical protein
MKHNFNYTIEKSEEAYTKLEVKHDKLNREFARLEIENLKLRDLLKDLL